MLRLPRTQFSDATLETLRPFERQFDEQIARLEEELIAFRRRLHMFPEPSGEEVATSRLVAERLQAAGLEPRIGENGIGVIADFSIGTVTPSTPLIAVRADMDALRIPDQKAVEYASQTAGVMHACGHDAHTTIALAVALAASAVQREATVSTDGFGARIRFVFQPAEETSQGAAWMVEQGAMDGVKSIIALHVDPERKVGDVGIRYGGLTAHCDELSIRVEGHGGHAARPHHAVDPVAAAAHLVSTLYEFLPRSIDSRSPAVLTIGQINGGYAPNVIPDHVTLNGSLRTTQLDARQHLKQRISQICAGIEQSSGARIHIEFASPLAAVTNDPLVTSAMEAAAARVVGSDRVQRIDHPSMGGEDFSVYLDRAPGCLLRLGCGTGDGPQPFLHSPLFDLDERAISVGARILARAALLLTMPG